MEFLIYSVLGYLAAFVLWTCVLDPLLSRLAGREPDTKDQATKRFFG